MSKSRSWGAVAIGCVSLAMACGVSCSSSNSGDDGAGGNDASTTDGKTLDSDGSSPKDGGSSDTSTDAPQSLCTSTPCVVQIAAAGDHTCALLSDKTIRCWGQNNSGELGVGSTDDAGGFDAAPYSVPNPVPGLSGID